MTGSSKTKNKKNIVVVGGGTGNHTTLTGLRKENCNLTAVVTMTDSGGSSGRLREELGHLPPGDIRQCLMALASDDSRGTLMKQLFDYRFVSGDGLTGHNFGNLILSALTEVTGNTVTSIEEASKLLGVEGSVLPVTLTRSTLVARLEDGSFITGESSIDLRRDNLNVAIDYVELEPKAYVYPPVVDAIQKADAIVLGPGDIYTSVLPNLLVDSVADAIKESKAKKIHVCNLMTKPGESDGFKASNFIKLLVDYLGTENKLDYLIINSAPYQKNILERYASEGQHPVELDTSACEKWVKNIISEPILGAGVKFRHDPFALAKSIMSIV